MQWASVTYMIRRRREKLDLISTITVAADTTLGNSTSLSIIE
jgi:hypothetical protein